MANHKSAIKRERQSEKRRVRNKSVRARVRTFVKKVMGEVESGDAAQAAADLGAAVREVSKASSKGVIPKKTASRKISRLTKQVNKVAAAK